VAALIETTAALWVMAAWISPVTAAVKFAALVVALAGDTNCAEALDNRAPTVGLGGSGLPISR
jgi:hypothetical protein